MTSFHDFALDARIVKAVEDAGYQTATPIQAQAIPHLLKGKDVLGIAQTGTGKTAAFALPTLAHLHANPKPRREKSPRVLVLAPTRELAAQIGESFLTYAKTIRCGVETVYGGVKIHRQIRNLARGTEVLIATPGRLVDLMRQGAVRLDSVEVLILDEADQMLDMGFINDIKTIVGKTPDSRQTVLFSATMPKGIAALAAEYLNDPVKVSVTPQATTAEKVSQGVLHVTSENKMAVLEALLGAHEIDRALVFTRTKHGADKVVKKLKEAGIQSSAIHGNKTQGQRTRALQAFRDGSSRVLIATDIAARGIDIDGITHVINFELPNVPDQYVHRIGRTARAGREGCAISLVASDELFYLREIEKLTRMEIEVLPAPEGLENRVLSAPSRDEKVVKPKMPTRNGGRRQQGGAANGQARPKRSSAPRPHGDAAKKRRAPRPGRGAKTARQSVS
ncbi:MAG: DEAD/DEAH box helicase [Parvularcula sp.]|nr:DEAD/DEAH box helicase [Parvularcula sp.]